MLLYMFIYLRSAATGRHENDADGCAYEVEEECESDSMEEPLGKGSDNFKMRGCNVIRNRARQYSSSKHCGEKRTHRT